MTTTCLIIEDHPEISRLFEKIVSRKGLTVEVIDRGDRALEHLPHVTPHLILLDLNLPAVSGQEILGWIRQQPHLSHTKVIVISADYSIAQTLEDQADLVLLKPVDTKQLSHMIDRLLQ